MPDTGADLGVPLADLYDCAHDHLPDAMRSYKRAANHLDGDYTFAFNRSGVGWDASGALQRLLTSVSDLMVESSNRLDAVAEALHLAVRDVAEADDQARRVFEQRLRKRWDRDWEDAYPNSQVPGIL